MKEIPNAKIHVMERYLASFASVKTFASAYKSLDLPLNLLIMIFPLDIVSLVGFVRMIFALYNFGETSPRIFVIFQNSCILHLLIVFLLLGRVVLLVVMVVGFLCQGSEIIIHYTNLFIILFCFLHSELR